MRCRFSSRRGEGELSAFLSPAQRHKGPGESPNEISTLAYAAASAPLPHAKGRKERGGKAGAIDAKGGEAARRLERDFLDVGRSGAICRTGRRRRTPREWDGGVGSLATAKPHEQAKGQAEEKDEDEHQPHRDGRRSV